jgi:UDP-GlcNAc:undecaprenyl-phosphate GlcNAc-1-phosphate transferase
MFKYLAVFITGFALSFFLMVFLRKTFLKYRVFISKDMPLAGGIGIGAAFVFSSLAGIFVFRTNPNQIYALDGISLLMLAFGLVDDLKELSVVKKFLVQFFCAVLLTAVDIKTHIVYLGFWGNWVVSLIWILGITNAFNLLDVVDGLASGVALIVSSALFIIAVFNLDFNGTMLSLALGAAVFGFFIFNFPPAKIYLGNSGSHFLGFNLAALALMLGYASLDRQVALLSPVIIFGLPLLDTIFLVYFRFKKGMIPFHKSNDHIVLKLMRLGLSQTESLFFMLGLALFFSLCGIIISKANNFIAAITVLSVVLVNIGLFRMLIGIRTDA